MESRRRRIRLKLEADEKNAGDQAVGLQAGTQTIANTSLHRAARKQIDTFVTQALAQKRLVHFEDHRQRKIIGGLVEPNHDPFYKADGYAAIFHRRPFAESVE